MYHWYENWWTGKKNNDISPCFSTILKLWRFHMKICHSLWHRIIMAYWKVILLLKSNYSAQNHNLLPFDVRLSFFNPLTSKSDQVLQLENKQYHRKVPSNRFLSKCQPFFRVKGLKSKFSSNTSLIIKKCAPVKNVLLNKHCLRRKIKIIGNDIVFFQSRILIRKKNIRRKAQS